MKILGNFNTNLDSELLKGRVFIIKRYFLYLFNLQNILNYISFCIVLGFFIYYQNAFFGNIFGTAINLLYVSMIIYWVLNLVKFFYYYIVHFKWFYTEKDKGLLEKQDVVYDKTLQISFVLLIMNFIISIISVFYIVLFTGISQYKDFIIFLLLNISLIFLQWRIIKKTLIDLEMSFTSINSDLKKIDQITQSGFFKISYNGATFDLISSLDGNSSGIIRSWLKFGQIDIVTMSNSPNITITHVKHPEKVANLILRAKNQK